MGSSLYNCVLIVLNIELKYRCTIETIQEIVVLLVDIWGFSVTLRRHGTEPGVPKVDQTNLMQFQYSKHNAKVEEKKNRQ